MLDKCVTATPFTRVGWYLMEPCQICLICLMWLSAGVTCPVFVAGSECWTDLYYCLEKCYVLKPRGKIHQAFPLCLYILQVIKNWSQGRPGNKAWNGTIYKHHLVTEEVPEKYLCTFQMSLISSCVLSLINSFRYSSLLFLENYTERLISANNIFRKT